MQINANIIKDFKYIFNNLCQTHSVKIDIVMIFFIVSAINSGFQPTAIKIMIDKITG